MPAYLPDNPTVRGDLLDYALEVEYFDGHVGSALEDLEELRGARQHACCDDFRSRDAVSSSERPDLRARVSHSAGDSLGEEHPAGRAVEDFINTRDFAPTFLQAAGVPVAGSMTGKSFLDVLRSEKAGSVDASRNVMYIAKERHDIGRPNNWGYPVRAVRTREFLYVRNYEPDRWPAGNPETGYTNVDNSPSKDLSFRASTITIACRLVSDPRKSFT